MGCGCLGTGPSLICTASSAVPTRAVVWALMCATQWLVVVSGLGLRASAHSFCPEGVCRPSTCTRLCVHPGFPVELCCHPVCELTARPGRVTSSASPSLWVLHSVHVIRVGHVPPPRQRASEFGWLLVGSLAAACQLLGTSRRGGCSLGSAYGAACVVYIAPSSTRARRPPWKCREGSP